MKVWIYMVNGKNGEDDLAQIEAKGFDTWRANPNTKSGDIILMYSTRPRCALIYVFRAVSDCRSRKHYGGRSWRYQIDIGDAFRLPAAIGLAELKKTSALRGWSFVRMQQGTMRRRRDICEEGYWPELRKILISRAPGLRRYLAIASIRRRVFISYASEDREKVQSLYRVLKKNGLNPWLDTIDLESKESLDKKINDAIKSSQAAIPCLSNSFWENPRYMDKEIGMILKISDKRKHFVYPVLLENCRIPHYLKSFQAINLSNVDPSEAETQLKPILRLAN